MAVRPHRVERGRDGQLVSVSLSGAAADIGEPLATLRERYLPALERLLPEARGAEILDFTATREPRATFRGAPGTARLRPGARTSVASLYLAGAWTDTGWPATMESAVRSGLAAAAAARADLARGRHARSESRRVSVTDVADASTPRSGRSRAAPSTCSRSSIPTAGGRASSRPT